MSFEGFKNRFAYVANMAGFVGVEREFFICERMGNQPVPRAEKVLSHIALNDSALARLWPGGRDREHLSRLTGYELSACQVETRTDPVPLSQLLGELRWMDRELDAALADLGLRKSSQEVGPQDMPLDVYPDPTGRYQAIVNRLSHEELLAGCRVIGTHIHVGMPDHETALRVYNYLTQHVQHLCELGNGSFGERLAIYRQMAPDYKPIPYASWADFYESAQAKGFAEDPRKCWTLIRISVHGTIEFRMFGATDSVERIERWASICHGLCIDVMALA